MKPLTLASSQMIEQLRRRVLRAHARKEINAPQMQTSLRMLARLEGILNPQRLQETEEEEVEEEKIKEPALAS